MAIDSADKRSSAMSLLTDMVVAMTPDGSIVALDRQHVAGFYRGISAAEVSVGVGPPYDVQAAEIFVAGAVRGEAFLAGAVAGETFTAGAVVGDVDT